MLLFKSWSCQLSMISAAVDAQVVVSLVIASAVVLPSPMAYAARLLLMYKTYIKIYSWMMPDIPSCLILPHNLCFIMAA